MLCHLITHRFFKQTITWLKLNKLIFIKELNTIIWPKQQKPIHLENQVFCINGTIYNQDERPLQWTAFHPHIRSTLQPRRHHDRAEMFTTGSLWIQLYNVPLLSCCLGYIYHTICGELWWNPSQNVFSVVSQAFLVFGWVELHLLRRIRLHLLVFSFKEAKLGSKQRQFN